MRFIRAAGPDDLDALVELAALSGPGFTSLPADEAILRDRLRLSAASFAGEIAPAEAWYTLMLENSGNGLIEGVASVKAVVGTLRPHFSFRILPLEQHSPSAGIRFVHQALVLANACRGWTEVGSLFLRPEARANGAGALLARSRYMLIGAEPERFAATVMAQLRGWFETDGRCPFWEGVTGRFFRIPFADADRMVTASDGRFIADLAPRHPIYLELIDASARQAIGRCHRDGEAALAMLEAEGFTRPGLVDLFDGGPTVTCARDRIATIARARRRPARIAAEAHEGKTSCISSTQVAGFRAVRAPAVQRNDDVLLEPETADLLRVREGDAVQLRA